MAFFPFCFLARKGFTARATGGKCRGCTPSPNMWDSGCAPLKSILACRRTTMFSISVPKLNDIVVSPLRRSLIHLRMIQGACRPSAICISTRIPKLRRCGSFHFAPPDWIQSHRLSLAVAKRCIYTCIRFCWRWHGFDIPRSCVRPSKLLCF